MSGRKCEEKSESESDREAGLSHFTVSCERERESDRQKERKRRRGMERERMSKRITAKDGWRNGQKQREGAGGEEAQNESVCNYMN